MGFNLSQITNQILNVQEQNSYNLVFNPLRPSEVVMSSGTITKLASQVTGAYTYSTTQGTTIKYKFRGRRIGIVVNQGSNYGKFTFDVDGVAYPALNCNSSDSFSNVPHIVATDLDDTEHVITVTKLDANPTAFCGFLVDDASTARTFSRAILDYHAGLNNNNANPTNIGTTDTSFLTYDFWLLCATITNTTASPINVTLKNNGGSAVMGPFPVPANDTRVISGLMYFSGGLKAIASATGCYMTIGGQ